MGSMRRRFLEAKRILGWRIAWVAPLWLVQHRYLVLVRDLGAPMASPPNLEELGVRRTVLTPDDVAVLVATDPSLRKEEIDRRLAEGQECLLYWSGSRLAHYRWETTQSAFLPYLGLTLRLLAGDACTTWAFTHPDFRGRGLMVCSSAEELHRLRRNGLRRSIALVAWWNLPSLQVTRDRAGRSVVGSVGHWQVGPARTRIVRGAVRLDSPHSFHVGEAT